MPVPKTETYLNSYKKTPEAWTQVQEWIWLLDLDVTGVKEFKTSTVPTVTLS